MPAQQPAVLHDRLREDGLPVISVRDHGDRYEVILANNATPAQQAQADATAASYRDEPELADRVPVTLNDALALLQASPTDGERQTALAIVRAHADSLRP